MAREPKQQESDEAPGAPEWMVTFSDCMTLLLTFFVLLLSFSSFDDRVFYSLKAIYSKAFTSITIVPRSDRDALVNMPPVRYVVELDKGSEKPTESQGKEENLLKENDLLKLRPGFAVLIPSQDLFWGQGTRFSTGGSRTMDLVGAFLKNVPSRVVISEGGPGNSSDSVHFGLPRAWVVMEYFTTKAGLEKERFSISQASSLPQASSALGSTQPGSERKVEIVLLERSIYN